MCSLWVARVAAAGCDSDAAGDAWAANHRPVRPGSQQRGLQQDANLSHLSRRNETAIYNGIALVTNRSKPWSQLQKTTVLIFASFCIKVHTVRRVSVRNCRQTWFLQCCKYQQFNKIRNFFAMIRIPSLAPSPSTTYVDGFGFATVLQHLSPTGRLTTGPNPHFSRGT
jgi:hypothetical protein